MTNEQTLTMYSGHPQVCVVLHPVACRFSVVFHRACSHRNQTLRVWLSPME